MSESLVDPTSCVKSVQQEITTDRLRWKSLVHSVGAGEPQPPARIIQRLGQSWDFDPETSTAAFMDDVSTLKKHRQLLNQQKIGETAMKDWTKKYDSPEELKKELIVVQNRSVEIRTQLSRHWQAETGNSRRHWQIQKLENENSRIFGK
jgi:hypothetical protein